MKFKSYQIKVLAILNTIAIALFICVFTIFSPSKAEETGGGGTQIIHDKFRSSRVATNTNLEWEINIGGSGDEKFLRAFPLSNGFLLFFESTSTDYDLADSGGNSIVAVRISANGKPVEYNYYAGEYVNVTLLDEHYYLLVNLSDNAKMLQLNSNGKEVSSNEIEYVDSNEKCVDFIVAVNQNGTEQFVVIFEYTTSLQVKIRACVYPTDFASSGTNTTIHERTFKSEGKLKYIACYQSGTDTYTLATQYEGLTERYLSLFKWGKQVTTEKVINKDINSELDNYYSVYSFIPYSNGYAALIQSKDNKPYVIKINKDLIYTTKEIMSENIIHDGSIYEYNNKYYIYTASNASSKMFVTDRNLTDITSNELTSFKTTTNASTISYSSKGAIFGVTLTNSCGIIGINTSTNVESSITFATSFEIVRDLIPTTNGVIAICESPRKSADVGGNFGNNDIWITKVKYN